VSRKKSTEARKRQRDRKREREAHLSPEILASFKAINQYVEKYHAGKVKERSACAKVRANRRKLIKLSESQNHRCCYCGGETWHPNIIDYGRINDRTELTRATIEHLLPDSQGGTYRMDNLAMACSDCNNARGDQSIEEFLQSIHAPPPQPNSNRAKKQEAKISRERQLKEEKKTRNRLKLLMIALWMFPEDYQHIMENNNRFTAKALFGGKNKPTPERKVRLKRIRHRVRENRMAA